MKPVNIKQIKKFEGRKVTQLPTNGIGKRTGLITDVVVSDNEQDRGELRGIVLWDSDEVTYLDDRGKIVIDCDFGVADFPLIVLMNKERFQIT